MTHQQIKDKRGRPPKYPTLNALERARPRRNFTLTDLTFADGMTTVGCRCNVCGWVWRVLPESVMRGCGCRPCAYRKVGRSQRRTNKTTLRTIDCLVVDVSTPTFVEAEMLIHPEDWTKLQSLGCGRSCASRQGKTVYASTTLETKRVSIHRLLFPGVRYLDHKNGNGLDNRRGNVRPCTQSENMANRRIPPGKSGITGVYGTSSGKWQARIKVNGKVHCLGSFETIEEAVVARKHAEEKYQKGFSYANSRG